MAGFDSRAGFAFGDVVLVPFPVGGLDATEHRPAVVISSAAYNRKRAHVLVMAVTLRDRPNGIAGEVAIEHWEEAGLDRGAVLEPVVATIDQRRIRLIAGQLHERDRRTLGDLLRLIFGGDD